MSEQTAGKLLWEPNAERVAAANVTAFIQWVNTTYDLNIQTYRDLWEWSVDDISLFWDAIRSHYGIQLGGDFSSVLGDATMPGANWYPGSRVNLAEHLLRRGDLGDLNRPAIFAESECREGRAVNWRDMREQVAKLATYLREAGIKPGDHVAAYLPISVEAVVAMLAAISVGAVWSSCSPDFGSKSVLERFAQVNPKVIFGVTGYRYNGKDFNRKADFEQICAGLSQLHTVIHLPWLNDDVPTVPSGVTRASWGDTQNNSACYETFSFEQVDFAHPAWVLYTSGTTGLPKGIVHCQGGILLEFTKYGWLHDDLGPDSVKFFYTSTGWTMFNLLVGGFATGSAIVVYDGSPTFPDRTRLWEMASRLGATYFGSSPTFLNGMAQADYSPKAHFDLSKIRTFAMTGSPASPENFEWVYNNVGEDLHLVSMSGGTDVASAFVAGIPTMPVHAGEIQVPCLAVDVCALDESGAVVTNEDGELAIRQPMPSMPIYFWNDANNERYLGSYFDMYPGIWRQGDLITFNDRMGCVISGRSDATLNRYGIRIGTSEIYRSVEAIAGITDSLIVNLELPGATFYMPLFVTLAEGFSLDEDMLGAIKKSLSRDCSPRHVPDEVFVVDTIPYTLTGKKQEIPVKKLLMGIAPDKAVNLGACANPEAMNFFIDLARRSDLPFSRNRS